LRVAVDTGVLIAALKKKGEKFHEDSVRLAEGVREEGAVASALVLVEFPGALAASTTMPIEKIYVAEATVQQEFNLQIMPFHPYVERAVSLMFELRDLKRRLRIEAADFHHLATAIEEGCSLFVTVDERHLLRQEVRSALEHYIEVCNPKEALEKTG